MRPLHALAVGAAALLGVVAAAAPAQAQWLSSSDPNESVNATLKIDDSPKVGPNGWRVTWKLKIKCPRGQRIIGRALLAERDPAAIPQLAGEDQGITATRDLHGATAGWCTGRQQSLVLSLRVADTVVNDPSTGDPITFHEPIHPTPSTRTTAFVTLSSVRSTADGGFFVQYCSAPNCAADSGPRLTFR